MLKNAKVRNETFSGVLSMVVNALVSTKEVVLYRLP